MTRVRETFEERYGPTRGGIGVSVTGAKVVLMGGLSDERIIIEAVRLVHGVEGVRGVESRIKVIGFHTQDWL
jgi:osmotically-inducible protein OsmY